MEKKTINGHRFHEKLEDKNIQNGIIVSLVGACTIITVYFHIFLNISTVFTHFYYVPIIISALWWKRRGLLVTAFLSVVLIITRLNTGLSFFGIEDDLFRIMILFFVSIVAIILAESISSSQESLKSSEEKFREVFNKVNDIMTLIEINENGRAGNYIEVNDVAVSKLGYSKEEFAKMTPRDIGTSKKGVDNQIKELLSLGYSTFERTYYSKDGLEIPVEINSHIFMLKGKKIALSVARDVTERKKAENALRDSEERYRFISENTADVIWLLDIESQKFDYVSPSVFYLRGYTAEEVISQSMVEVMTPESYQIIMKDLPIKLEAFIAGEDLSRISSYKVDQIHKDGSIIPTEVVTTLLTDSEGKPEKFLGVSRDISERMEKERQLKESEEKYRTLFQMSPDYIALIDLDGKIIEFNDAAGNLIEMGRDEAIGKSFFELGMIIPENIPFYQQKMALLNDSKDVKPYETVLLDKNGHERWVELFNTPLKKYDESYAILIIANDITERKLAEDQLKESLSEKEMLLKEIHHRVKNNLMIISSLLSIQSRFIKDKEALGIFKESQNRAKSMALIHERLYRSTDLKRIDMGDYIRTLSNDLFYAYVTNDQKIQIKLDVEDIMVDINTSIPLGLIINEIITNALKHAFPNEMPGSILISFHRAADKLKLEVADDGIGFPKDLDYKNTSSMGLQLVNSLSNQIDAELTVVMEKGTSFQITFPEKTF
ncbi:MAG: PAS domain S-box protein [Methanobacteriaceae archaeon]|nr:PAS domain S-box protein [Methanobacteriaceae archaeon]